MNRIPKVYVGSSWSNDGPLLDEVHDGLRAVGFETLDFRINGRWWGEGEDSDGGSHPLTGRLYTPNGQKALKTDLRLMRQADCGFFVHPCGIATALEAGWCAGANKPTVVWGREVRKPLDITWGIVEALGAILLGSTLEYACDELRRLDGLKTAMVGMRMTPGAHQFHADKEELRRLMAEPDKHIQALGLARYNDRVRELQAKMIGGPR